MSKQSGLGSNFYVGGVDVSGDIGSLSKLSGSRAQLDVTGIDKLANERLFGVRDGAMSWSAFFNPTGAHPVFAALPTTDIVATYAVGPLAGVGSAGACLVAKQVNYDGNRGTDGSFTFNVDAVANAFGLDWGYQLTAGKRTDTTATSPATGVDFVDASTAFGWQAYLQVFAVTGTSVTVTLQDSADNSSFTNLTGGAFTAATGVTTQRLQGGTTATVRRYVRAITTGTFTVGTFNVVFVRNYATQAI